jgi:hypothetical protein
MFSRRVAEEGPRDQCQQREETVADARLSERPRTDDHGRWRWLERNARPAVADETGLVLHVHHYPPGSSKWNKIEHRLFCHVTQTRRGRPLVNRMAVVGRARETSAVLITDHEARTPLSSLRNRQ